MGAGVDLGGYGIEGGEDVAYTVIGLKILYGLGVVGGVVVAADSGLASAGDLAARGDGTNDAYLGYPLFMSELAEKGKREVSTTFELWI